MGYALVIDVLLGVVLVISIMVGASRGLYRSIMSFVSAVLGIVAAALLSRILAAPVGKILEGYLGDTLSSMVQQAAGSVFEALVEIVLFVPLFVILMFVFKAIFAGMNDLFKIPFTGAIDKILGAVLAFVETLLVMWLCVYIVEYFQVDVPEDLYSDSFIISFLVNTSPSAIFKLILGTINS